MTFTALQIVAIIFGGLTLTGFMAWLDARAEAAQQARQAKLGKSWTRAARAAAGFGNDEVAR